MKKGHGRRRYTYHEGRKIALPPFTGVDCGEYLTEDQAEFAMAMEKYKRKNHRPHPSCSEVLEVVKALGYVKHGLDGNGSLSAPHDYRRGGSST